MSFGLKPDQANASETSDDSGVVFDNQKSMTSTPVATETTQASEATANQTSETAPFGANNNDNSKANNNETCGNPSLPKSATKTTATSAGTIAETSVTSSSVFGTVTTTPAAVASGTVSNQTLQAAHNIQTFGLTNRATNNPGIGAAFGYIYVPHTANSQTFGLGNQLYGIQSHSYGIPYRHLGLPSQNFGANNTNAAVRGASGATSAPDNTNTQTVGTGKDQNSATTNNNTVSGSGLASLAASNTTHTRAFGTASNQGFGIASNQNFGAANDSNAFGVAFRAMSANAPNNQPMGVAAAGTAGPAGGFGSMSAPNATNIQQSGAAPSGTAGTAGMFGSAAAHHTAQAYEAAFNQAFGAQNNQGFGTNTANNQTFGGASSAMPNNAGAQFGAASSRNYWNQPGLNTQPSQRQYAPSTFGNNTNNEGKLGTTNINIDEPIVITGLNDNIGLGGSWLYPSMSRGLFDPFSNNNNNVTDKLSSTNITVHQPITITEHKNTPFGIQPNPQPTQTVFGVPVTTTSSNGMLSTTNIIVRKPISLTGTSNTFKFGINPTQTTTVGSFNAPMTTSALEKLCTTNININKPISINGNSHGPGRNSLCPHNCHICRMY